MGRFTRITLVFATQPYRRISMTLQSRSLVPRYQGRARELLRYSRLHHYLGHDPRSDVREILIGVFDVLCDGLQSRLRPPCLAGWDHGLRQSYGGSPASARRITLRQPCHHSQFHPALPCKYQYAPCSLNREGFV